MDDDYRAFRSRVLAAFVAGHISCDCEGICHNQGCPLGELEIEADIIRGENLAVVQVSVREILRWVE